jgi:hypothetical protein
VLWPEAVDAIRDDTTCCKKDLACLSSQLESVSNINYLFDTKFARVDEVKKSGQPREVVFLCPRLSGQEGSPSQSKRVVEQQ